MTTKESYLLLEHNANVAKLARKISKKLMLSDEFCDGIYIAGMFCDIGKIQMDSKILNQKNQLTTAEFDYLRRHSSMSTQILVQLNIINSNVLTDIIHHHENYDGSGYPAKLKGEQIPLGSRILRMCDAYFALLEDRPYRVSFSKEAAIEILQKEKEKYDPTIYRCFMEVVLSEENE